jgi:hypothetical protein
MSRDAVEHRVQDIVVESELRGSLGTWRGTLWIVAAWVCLPPLGVWGLAHHLHTEISFEYTLILSALITVVGIFCTLAMIHGTYFAITPTHLQVGRRPRETVIEFSDIESIVVGLPEQQSRLMRLARHSHYNALAYQEIVERRRDALLLRLRGGRYLALYIPPRLVGNAEMLRFTVLQVNRCKVVGADSYTPEEIKRLGNPYFNRIGNL